MSAAVGGGGVAAGAAGAVEVRSGAGSTVDELVAGLIAAHDLASASGPDGSEGGVAVQVQIERTLRSAGVDRLLVAENDLFDPAFHLVAATEPAPDTASDRHIAREVRAGWMSAAGVLRPAEVVVWTG